LTEDEEQSLLDGLCIETNPNWMLALNRRVMHFGFSFNYRTLLLDYTAETPSIPPDISCSTGLLERVQCVSDSVSSSFGSDGYPINQITVNEYLPGQGIASHTDATTCFGPVICIISLATEIAMTFIDRSTGTDPSATVNDESSSPPSSSSSATTPFLSSSTTSTSTSTSNGDDSPTSTSASSSGSSKRVSVWLPRRSLMVMAGPARYSYSHGIAARRTDKHENGITIERSRRVSLTFRQVR